MNISKISKQKPHDPRTCINSVPCQDCEQLENKGKNNMKKYKVEFIEKSTFIVDVEAKNEQEAKIKAEKKWIDISNDGMEHYHEEGDSLVETGTVFDITDTDDPFNP